jgi:DNA-binding Xre family transcriptional regulator
MMIMISFEPLWKTLKEKEISQYQLIHTYKVSAGQLSRLRANNNVSTHTINILCEILQCSVGEIMVYIPSHEKRE